MERIVRLEELNIGNGVFEFTDSKASFENNAAYIKIDEEGYILRPDLAKKVNMAAKSRWENGGKEIHDKWMADENFSNTQEFKDYFKKHNISEPVKMIF